MLIVFGGYLVPLVPVPATPLAPIVSYASMQRAVSIRFRLTCLQNLKSTSKHQFSRSRASGLDKFAANKLKVDPGWSDGMLFVEGEIVQPSATRTGRLKSSVRAASMTRAGSGMHFDPGSVVAFVRTEETVRAIAEQFVDP